MHKLLIPIDIEYRIKRGDKVSVADYEKTDSRYRSIFENAIASQFGNGANDTTQTTDHRPQSSRSRFIGNYKLLQKLGEGGMGTVWMAEQVQPVRRRVALKLIKAGYDRKEVVARFEAERQALAMMDHQNIAKVFDGGTTETGQPYFVMELVQGIPFNKYCDQHKLSIDERLDLFVPICNAVQHAHQKGIIHRDLKPSNILISLYDGKPIPKVIDFGLAKALQHQSRLTDKTLFTEFGQVVGTLQYMSPEQAEMNQLDVDTRTDIYSLGVILYELLTGSTPIDEDTLRNQAVLKVLESIREREPLRPSARLSIASNEAVSGVSQQRQIEPNKLKHILRGELDWIVMKALEKDRTRRYETANGFAEDIRRYLSGDVVVARPPSMGYRLKKHIVRNRGIVISSFAIFTLLIGGLLATSWFAIEADSARRTADEKTLIANQEREKSEKERDRANENEIKATQALDETRRTLSRSHYHLANSYWDAGRARDAKRYLSKIPSIDRKIEWLWARREFEGSYATMYGHKPYKVRFTSPTEIVSIGEDDSGEVTLRRWDFNTATEKVRTHLNTNNQDNAIFYAMDPLVKKVYIGRKNRFECWDIESNTKVFDVPNGALHCEFSEDGKFIATMDPELYRIRILNSESGAVFNELQSCRYRGLTSLALTSTGNVLAYPSQDGQGILVYDVSRGMEVSKWNYPLVSATGLMAYSRDQRYLVVADGMRVTVRDAKNGDELCEFKNHSSEVTEVCISPDCQTIASGDRDAIIYIWDATTGRQHQVLKGHDERITGIDFHPSGEWLVSSSFDKTIKLWDLRGSSHSVVFSHEQKVTEIHVHPNRPLLLSASGDDSYRLWNSESGELMQRFTGVSSIAAFSQNGKWFAIGRENGIDVHDCTTFKTISKCRGLSQSPSDLVFIPDSALLAGIDNTNTILLWNCESGELLEEKNILPNLTGLFTPGAPSIAVSSDGSKIAAGGLFPVHIFRLPHLELECQIRHENQHQDYHVLSIAFLNTNETLAISDGVGQLEFWDRSNNAKNLAFKHTQGVTDFDFLENENRLFSTCWDSSLTLWDTSSGEELRRLQSTHGVDKQLNDVAISPDRTFLATTAGNTALLHPILPIERSLDLPVPEKATKAWLDVEEDRVYAVSEVNGESKWYAWTLSTGIAMPIANRPDIDTLSNRSSDGRWEVFTGAPVIVIDRNISKSPKEIQYRRTKSQLDARWHRNEALRAKERKNDYAELIHRAWQLTLKPNDFLAYELFHECVNNFQKLSAEGMQRHEKVEMPPIAMQAVAISQGVNLVSPDTLDFVRAKEKALQWEVSARYWKTYLTYTSNDEGPEIDRKIATICLANAQKQLGSTQEFLETCREYNLSENDPFALETGFLNEIDYVRMFNRLVSLGFMPRSGKVTTGDDELQINAQFTLAIVSDTHTFYTLHKLADDVFENVHIERQSQNQRLVHDVKYVLNGVEYHFAIWHETAASTTQTTAE